MPSTSTWVSRKPPETSDSSRDPRDRIGAGRGPPSFDHHLSLARIHRGDDALARKRAEEFGRGGRPDDDARGAGVEPVLRRLHRANAAPDPAGRATDHFANEGRVRSLAQRGVEINDGDFAGHAEFLQTGEGIAAVEDELASAPKLHGAAVHQVDTGDDHGLTS